MGTHRTSIRAKAPKVSARGRRKGLMAKPNWIWIGLGAVGVLGALFLLLRPTDRGPTEITAAQAYDKYQSGAFFLDVRGEAEWNDGHIPGSVVIPLDELAGRLGELPEDRDIVVVCALGVRSAEGARILVEAGFSPVACLGGGLGTWEEVGYPLEQGVP
jgi:rhodanese-related sulfurtransferase